MNAQLLQQKHNAGLPYDDYVRSGTPRQYEDWTAIYDRIGLTEGQTTLIKSFTRKMNVIAISGIWCGDCVQQGPLIQRIAEANPQRIDLRWLDRDEHADLQASVAINGGHRVPVILFCAEDCELVSWYGDRTLSRYRKMASQQLGPACPMPGAEVPIDELAATIQDWLDQFERVALLLRLSARLREKNQD